MCEYDYYESGIPQGWQCPICKRVYAPFVYECSNCGKSNVVTNISISPDTDWYRIFKEYYVSTERQTPIVTLKNINNIE